jgi:hypothetical protein
MTKTYPDTYARVRRNRKLSMQPLILLTTQTLALAQLGRLNDTQMKKLKLRSFLKHMAKVNIGMATKEIERIDMQVGLHRTKLALFGSYIHGWLKTKGKEKKAPEQVCFGNSKLAHEIVAEVDLYIRHLFLLDTNNELNAIPLLDYVADGFDRPGVTVLFGGDHGDRHCPISCKINLSLPAVQKEKRQLSYQCPVVVFASVECSADAYSLMDSTVMPMVKQQLKEVK